jgi:predicted DNA-binding transcriptional regulator AlpA
VAPPKAAPKPKAKPAPTPAPKADLLSLSDSFLSKEQVAEMLGVSTATLLRWHHLKQGPVRFKCGRQIWYRHEAVEEWAKLRELMGERSRIN